MITVTPYHGRKGRFVAWFGAFGIIVPSLCDLAAMGLRYVPGSRGQWERL